MQGFKSMISLTAATILLVVGADFVNSQCNPSRWDIFYWKSKGYWPWEVGTHRQYWGNGWALPQRPCPTSSHSNSAVGQWRSRQPPHSPELRQWYYDPLQTNEVREWSHGPVHAISEPSEWASIPVPTTNDIPVEPESSSCEFSFKCPFETHAFDTKTGKCYPLGHQGPPCGDKTVFVRQASNPRFGECLCIRPESTCGRPLSLWPDEGRCYELYTRGPCEEDEWLVPVRSVTSRCEKNPCVNMTASPGEAELPRQNVVFQFPLDGQCQSTESQAFCKEGEVARFLDGNGGPTCHRKEEQNCFHTVRIVEVEVSSRKY